MHERAPSLRKRFAPDRPRCWRARNWRRRAAEVAHRRLKFMPCSYFFVSLRYPPVMLISGLSRPRASAFAARFPLIGSSISFCPAAALRGFLPFAGQPRGCLQCCVSEHPSGRQRFHPSSAPSQQSACRYASAPSSSACCARPPRYNRRNPPSIYAHPMRQLFPKLRLCPNPKSIML